METRIRTIISDLTHAEIVQLDRDNKAVARTARLQYVNDSMPGITRVRRGNGFSYFFRDKPIKNDAELERIRRLSIPPAWSRVWTCPDANGHIQVTGYDIRERKQYRYHPHWNALRSETKFYKLYEFGKSLPALRLRLTADLQERQLNREKVIATVISVMDRTYVRIGSEDYEKLYG